MPDSLVLVVGNEADGIFVFADDSVEPHLHITNKGGILSMSISSFGHIATRDRYVGQPDFENRIWDDSTSSMTIFHIDNAEINERYVFSLHSVFDDVVFSPDGRRACVIGNCL